MPHPEPKQEAERRWVETWKVAGPELERIRAHELRAMTEEQAAALSEGLGFDPENVWVPTERSESHGLVEQQRLFMLSHEHPARHRRRA
jgi:hypothetical protein